MPKQSLEFSSNLNVAAVADYLEELARGLREGHVSLESGSENVALAVAGNVSLELEAKSNTEKGRTSIEIRLDWRKRKRSPEPAQPLVIQSNSLKADGSAPTMTQPAAPVAAPDQQEPIATTAEEPLAQE
ncbi:MAG TPA: amphi-Trp domain-containing protein [Dehalococcoidia bacterium]|nr:amphi-Trp domain-containing protein [Dehalococcoidia bacterium]